MKALLINPPRSPHNSILEHASEEAKPFIHRKLIGPPLGLITVAAAVNDLCDVALLDMKGEYDLNPSSPPPEQLVSEYLERHQPDVVGVTTIASEHNAAIAILRTVKAFDSRILTVAGGLHTTLCPKDYENDAVDLILPGQSAPTFREVIKCLVEKGPLGTVQGIYMNGPDGLSRTTATTRSIEAAGRDFVMPDRTYLKRWISTYVVGRSTDPATYLFTSLGCSYKCTFCSIWPQFKGRYCQRSVESVISELKTLDDYPVVRFADANTLLDNDFIGQLFNRIEEEGIRKTFIMDLRTDAVTEHPKLIERLAKGGLKVVISGFESFRNEELKRYNKTARVELINEAINIMHQNDIMIRGNYVIPPSYDEDDFKALADYASSHKVAFAGYTILSPMPGTVFFQKQKDRIVDWNLDKYNFFNSVLKTTLRLKKFYQHVADLWTIKKGKEVI